MILRRAGAVGKMQNAPAVDFRRRGGLECPRRRGSGEESALAKRKPDLVNDIYDLTKLEKLIVKRSPARPTKRLVAKTPAEPLAGMVIRHFNFGLGARVMPHRDEWIDAINSTQRPDGMWPKLPHACPWCDEMSPTGYVTAALWHLGGMPRYRVRPVEKLLKRPALVKWLAGRNWDHPWGGAGHECIGLVQTMANLGLGSRGAAQTVLNFVNERMRDPATGIIARGHYDEPGDQQFGSSFAFGIIFEFLKVDFPWADDLVEFILSRQHASGSWSTEFPGGSFNMDATWMLSRWTRHGSPRRAKAEAALRRLARWLRREVAARRGDEKEAGLMKVATTLLLLQEVFPSEAHRNRVWRYSCDMTIHP